MESKLPKNWVETEFKELTSFVIGGDWGKDLEFEFDVESEIVSCIRGSEIKKWEKDKGNTASIRKVKSSSLEKRALIEGDILIEISGGGPDQPVGRTIYIDKEALNVNSDHKKVCTNFLRLVRLYDNLDKKFVKNYLDSFYLSGEVLKYQGGSNNLRNLKFKEFETIKIPLPPLAEQQRIVAKLDTLFGSLDALKIRLNNIPQLIKNFKQAVLTQAVTGKLTQEWRVGKELEEWEESKLKTFSECRLGKMLDKAKNKGQFIDYLRNKNVRWFNIDFEDVHQMKVERSDLVKLKLEYGDILVCEGGEPGRAAIWKNERENIIFQKALHRIRLNSSVLPEYFLYNLKVDAVNESLNELFTGTTIKHLTGRAFSSYKILIPSIKEQTEIVKRVENLFSKADAIEKQYKTLKEKIDRLPQAILAKAFKGELVAQLPTDGDAKDLLEEIKKLKESLVVKPKKKVVRNKK
ncbi:restriction endonuclease subunit S [Tenacibaculum finnmarkense]|uniref:restriction endonuclease subunit S n=1 Tax=Tenacibaculum finnmarkense TaxID=2781243 RepID=UPI001EFB3112|nr:restriction endonuclease subunit S [Tenacibaculum finnmarkense]MCG8858894.1 restriction endonuclease subunit S [Tenacibaculum finnmarkense]